MDLSKTNHTHKMKLQVFDFQGPVPRKLDNFILGINVSIIL